MYPGSSLYEESMELYTILVVLLSYALIYANVIGVSTATTAILYRPSTLAVLLDNSHIINIYDRHADRSDDNATRDRKESMRS